MIKKIYILLIALVLLNTYCEPPGGYPLPTNTIGQVNFINKTNYPIYILLNPKTHGENLDNRISFNIGIGDSVVEYIQTFEKDTLWVSQTVREVTTFFGKNLRLRLWDNGNFKTKDTVNYKYKSFHNIYNYSFLQEYPNHFKYTYTFTEKDVKLADTIN